MESIAQKKEERKKYKHQYNVTFLSEFIGFQARESFIKILENVFFTEEKWDKKTEFPYIKFITVYFF